MFSVDTSDVTAMAVRFQKVALTSPLVVEGALRVIAPKVLAEQRKNVPIRGGDLADSLGIAWKGRSKATVGAITAPASWRAHFIENGTAHHGPQPFIRPAGDKYADEFAETILRLAGRI